MSVFEKLKKGEYKLKEKYPSAPKPECGECGSKVTESDNFCSQCGSENTYGQKLIEHQKILKERSKKEGELQQKFHDDAIEEVGLKGHPAAQRAFSYAWEKGHACGMHEVFCHLQSIAYVVTGK